MIFGAARVFPIGVTSGTENTLEVPGILHGWGWQNTSETNRADLVLTDGPIGPPIVPISLSPGQSTRDWLGALGIACVRGVTITITAGTVEGSLWFRPLPAERLHDTIDLLALVDELGANLFGG